jgi:UDP-glucuronate decarboxylase
LFVDYHRMNKVNIRIVRIFNTYGPRMHPYDGRVVSNFIRQALTGEDITIFGDGQQTRSFCYADDLIEGILRMMNGPDGFTGPVNIGNPGEFTILELAKLVIELTGSKSKLIHKPLPVDDPTRRRPDITLAKQKLGWEPKVPLAEGLAKTIAWFKSLNLDDYRPPTPAY